MCHNALSFMIGGVTSSSRYSGRSPRFGSGVVGFAGCVAGGLEVEEFDDLVVFTGACALFRE